MVDSLNLKKRILKMREAHYSNNTEINLNSSRIKKYEQHVPLKKNELFSNLDISKKNMLDNNNSKNSYEKQYNYDDQFKLLANKFNEAIEVILDLSERINKLEHIIYSKKNYFSKKEYSTNSYKIKLIVFIAFITLISFFLFFLPIDLNSTKLFLDEILLLL